MLSRQRASTIPGAPPRAIELVQINFRAKSLNSSLGKLMYGQDESQWPGWVMDAMSTIASAEGEVEDAMEADSSRS